MSVVSAYKDFLVQHLFGLSSIIISQCCGSNWFVYGTGYNLQRNLKGSEVIQIHNPALEFRVSQKNISEYIHLPNSIVVEGGGRGYTIFAKFSKKKMPIFAQ